MDSLRTIPSFCEFEKYVTNAFKQMNLLHWDLKIEDMTNEDFDPDKCNEPVAALPQEQQGAALVFHDDIDELDWKWVLINRESHQKTYLEWIT